MEVNKDEMEFLNFKNKCLMEIRKDSRAFLSTLRNYPIMQTHLDEAIRFFNTALLWLEDGIRGVPFQLYAIQQENAKTAAAQKAAASETVQPAPNLQPVPEEKSEPAAA